MDDREAREAAFERMLAKLEVRASELGGFEIAIFNAAIDAYLASLRKSFAVVPREASEEMIMSGIAERHGQPVPEAWSLATQNIYAAMLSAAEGK